jgi:hypothetical protein
MHVRKVGFESTEGYLSTKSAIVHLGAGFGPLFYVFGYQNF